MIFSSVLPVIWLVIILGAIFGEAYSERLVEIWFAPSALAALICGFFGTEPKIQVAVFILSAFVMISVAQAVRSAMCKKNEHNKSDTDIE